MLNVRKPVPLVSVQTLNTVREEIPESVRRFRLAPIKN